MQVLESRFDEHNNGDPMTELLKLKQTGIVSEYHDLFEFWLGRVDISEGYAVSFFLNGLKPIIQHQVKMFMPKTLAQAYALAQLQENSLKTLQQELAPQFKKPPLLPTPSNLPKFSPRTNFTSPNPSYQNTSTPNNQQNTSSTYTSSTPKRNFKPYNSTSMRTSVEFDERRAKGLCFWCDEKFVLGHKCKQKQLYLVEVNGCSEKNGYEWKKKNQKR